jgi:nucleoprotein TPR
VQWTLKGKWKLNLCFTVEEKAALQAQVFALSNSQTSSTSEVENLKHRVDDTDREKRDLMGVISRLKQENTQRDGN